jgi:hypothetical protein
MSGWNTITRVRRLEEQVDKLGFKFKSPRHGDWEQQERSLALVPKDSDALPIYNREAELYVGTLEGLETWLHGVRWAREYDMMLKLSDEKKRARKEQDERNRILLKTLKDSKIPDRIKT